MKFSCEAHEMPVIRQYPMGIHHDGGTVMNTQLDSACGCGESIILSTEQGTHFVEIPHAIILALATLIEAQDHQSQIENLLRAFIRAQPSKRGS